MKPTLTILTPIYNRANLLPQVFACLQKQTDMDFEWIIINDGSTDNSLAVAQGFKTDSFNIQVLNKPNGGKHTALNYAHQYIHGKYVLILDSDDSLTAHAVGSIKIEWKKYQHNTKIGMLIFLRGDNKLKPFCIVTQYNRPVDFITCKRTHILGRDCCEVIRTDLFKQFSFPEFPGEKFVSESALWNRLSQDYQCVYINKIIYICKYLCDGLTQAGISMRIKNPRGGMYVANTELTPKNSLKKRLKYGILYTCYGKFAGYTFRQLKEYCSNKIIFYLTYLGGILLYWYWKNKFISQENDD